MDSVRAPLVRRPSRTAAAALLLAAATALTPLTAAPVAHARDSAGGGHRLAEARGLKGSQLDRWIRAYLRRMPLEQQVGQLFTTYVYGTDPNAPDPRNRAEFGVDTPAEVVQKYHLGGVIYFDWTNNVDKGPTQVARLSNGLQRAAVGSGSHLPLMISADQEYGLVTRIREPATQLPGAMALGAARGPELARQAAGLGGKELKAIGITQNFAPVADVNVNPANPVIGVRSFGSDPQLVSTLAAAQINGYQKDAGISSAAKHFPGHGDTKDDSHTGLSYVHHSKEQWEKLDAPPFRAAVRSGIDVIMTGHLIVPAVDPTETPGTLSKPILTGLLREELGYDGVVITDALNMAGVRKQYPDDRIPVLALNAGADILLMPKDLGVAQKAVLDAVRGGEVSKARFEQALLRTVKQKIKNGVLFRPFVQVNAVDRKVGTPEHLKQAQAITDRSTTLVKNEASAPGGALPFRQTPGSMLVVGTGSTAGPAGLAASAGKRGTRTTVQNAGSAPNQAAVDAAVAAAGSNDVTVVLSNRSTKPEVDPNRRQAALVKALLATGKRVVVVAERDPYDISVFPEAPTFLATFSSQPVAMESLARVLYGERGPSGKLPVSVPKDGEPGTPLYPFGHGLSW
jgi:beta-N-acetylhexosaminidase